MRRQLIDDLVRLGLAGEAVDDAALLASELVGNAVRYGHPLPGGVLRVSWAVAAGRLVVQVTDGGGWDAPHVRDAGPRDTRGRGLAIVDTLAESWGVDRGRHGAGSYSTVWAELRVDADSSDRQAVN